MGKKIYKISFYADEETKKQIEALKQFYENSAVFVGIELKQSDIVRFCINYTNVAILH